MSEQVQVNPNARSRIPGWAAPVSLLTVGLVLRLFLAWQDHRVLLAEYLWYDDSFLALSIAHNLAHGHGMTCDGLNVTNGFQPLYVFLLVPILALIPEHNLTLPIHLAATVLALAGTAASGLFYLIARRLFSGTAALCVLFLITISTYFVAMDVNGLETAVYGLTLSAALYYYVTRFTGLAPLASVRQCVMLGFLCGLTILARIDAVIFVLLMALDYLRRHRVRFPAAAARIVVGVGVCLVTLLPWLLTSALLCGSIVPVSGPAVRWASSRIGWKEVGHYISPAGSVGLEGFGLDEVPWEYYANNVLHMSAQGLALFPLTAQFEGNKPLLVAALSTRFSAGQRLAKHPWTALGLVITGAVAVVILPTMLPGRRAPTQAGWRSLSFVRFAILAWLTAYAFYVFGPWHTYRYLYPVLAMLTLLSGALIDPLLSRLRAFSPHLARLALGGPAVQTQRLI